MMVLFTNSLTTNTSKKINSFKELPAGWHYGTGGGVTDDVASIALDLHSALLLSGLTKTDAFPGAGGEVLLTGYYRDHYIALTIEPDGRVDCAHELNGEELQASENLSKQEAQAWVMEAARGIWNLSGWFIPATSTILSNASMTSHSKNLLTEEECLFSTAIVERQLVA